jgi:hypothetical protein
MAVSAFRSMNLSITTSPVLGREAGHHPYPKRSFPKRSTKRVRTGCWTCRSRHLKCDESYPVCTPCQKSNRFCDPVRGVRLRGWKLKTWEIPEEVKCIGPIGFVDETRDIVREYDAQGIINGGMEAYGWHSEEESVIKESVSPIYGSNSHEITTSSATSHRSHTFSHSMDWTSGTQTPSDRQAKASKPKSVIRPHFLAPPWTGSSHTQHETHSQNPEHPLTNGEELQIFQAFVNDIARWMDTMTSVKYVRVSPRSTSTDTLVLAYNSISRSADPNTSKRHSCLRYQTSSSAQSKRMGCSYGHEVLQRGNNRAAYTHSKQRSRG